jgi:hypothetical protein
VAARRNGRRNGYEDAASPSGGPATDAHGTAVVDPTANVLAVINAATRRQDDLRVMNAEYQDKIADLRADHNTELRLAESARIDAIRAVDVAAVNRAAEVSSDAAEALRGQVATTAEAFRVTLAAALEPIQKDIAELRKTQYEQQGQKAQQAESRGDTRTGRELFQGWVGIAVVLAAAVIGFIAYHLH